MVTRGCSYNCAMCSIPVHMGFRIRLKPVEQVFEEVKTLKYENVYLADDTLFFPGRSLATYAEKLFKKLSSLDKKYFISSTLALRRDPFFLRLMADAGVRNLIFESAHHPDNYTLNLDNPGIKKAVGIIDYDALIPEIREKMKINES